MTKVTIIETLKRFDVRIEDINVSVRKGSGFICTHVACQHFIVRTNEDVIEFAKKVASFNMQCTAV